MRNLMGSTKYAPVANTGEATTNEVDNIQNSAKNTVISGQVRHRRTEAEVIKYGNIFLISSEIMTSFITNRLVA